MFSQLGALASKPKPKNSTSTSLPQRREREPEKKKSQEPIKEGEEKKEESSSSDSDKEGDQEKGEQDNNNPLSVEEETKLLQQIRSEINELENKLEELFLNDENNNNNTLKKQKVLTWIQLQLKKWRYELLVQKRQTDPDITDAMQICYSNLSNFSASQKEIQPMIEGLLSSLSTTPAKEKHEKEAKNKNDDHDHPEAPPQELVDNLLKMIQACREKKFLEAENIYFQALLGNKNWHLGIYAVGMSIKQEHTSFLRENVKSNLHNHEMRKMMVVFKELIMRDKTRFEQEEMKRKQQQK